MFVSGFVSSVYLSLLLVVSDPLLSTLLLLTFISHSDIVRTVEMGFNNLGFLAKKN